MIQRFRRTATYYRDSIALAENAAERKVLQPYLLGSCALCLLPRFGHAVLSYVVGAVRYVALPEKRREVRRGQRLVAGGTLGPIALELRTLDAFAWYTRLWIEIFAIAGYGNDEIDYRVTVEGIEHLDRALELADGKGIVAISGHVGNMDWMGSLLLIRGYPGMGVMTKLSPPILERWMKELRQRRGLRMETLGKGIMVQIEEGLRQGLSVALMSDFDVSGSGIATTLFGEEMKIPAGPAVLCARLGVPLVPMVAYMRRDGGHTLKVWEPILPPARDGAASGDRIRSIAEDVARAVEETIRYAPAQWQFGDELRARRGKSREESSPLGN
ncbi:MAG: lysophospholipid acyltransferase family protein [Acidimicrobiales bacterium]